MSSRPAHPSSWDERGFDPDVGDDFDAGTGAFATAEAPRSASPARLRGVDAWQPHEPLAKRVVRALSVPQLAGVAVFVVAVGVALTLVLTQTHDPAGETGPGDEVAFSSGQDAGAADSLGSFAATGASGGTPSSAAPSGSSSESGKADTVFVHVVGEVREPGVVEVPGDSRVRDAVEAAGGASEAAVLAGVNLARIVVDGEQIVVPDAALFAATQNGGPGIDGGASAGGAASGGDADGVVDLNTASAAQLETLPRVGQALAQRILDWRAANGRFSSVDQLLEVPGIGGKTLDGFRDRVRAS